MAKVPAFSKAPAIIEIRAPLARTSPMLSSVAAPMANRSVPAAGLPPAAPPGKEAAPPIEVVPAGKLDDAAVPAAHPFVMDAAPVANAAMMVPAALASFDAVPVE